jgi:Uma2 family endonuclease
MIIRGGETDYLNRHPGPEDVALVVEVSDTALNRDQTLKKQLYAAAAVPIYWVVNLPDSQIEVYSQPFIGEMGPDYQQRQTYGMSEPVPVWIGTMQIGEIALTQLFSLS